MRVARVGSISDTNYKNGNPHRGFCQASKVSYCSGSNFKVFALEDKKCLQPLKIYGRFYANWLSRKNRLTGDFGKPIGSFRKPIEKLRTPTQ